MRPRVGFVGLVAVLVSAAVAVAQPAARPQPPSTPAPIDLRLLPVWPGHVEGAAVQVHAADVDGEVLRAALAPRAHYVTLPVDKRVSGRVAVKKRAAALAALVALEPALANPGRALRGGGVKVDLDFRSASTLDLFRLFGHLLRTNIVVLAPDAKLTVRVKRAGASGVLAEMARVSGVELDRPAPNVIVVRPASEPQVAFIPASGPKLSLDARQLHAGILIALIRALDPTPPAIALRDASLVCNGGKAIDLRLTKVAESVALSVVALAGGADLRGPRCSLPPLPAGTDPGTLRLAGVVERGTKRLAAVEVTGKGAFLLDGSDPAWVIGSGWIEHRAPAGNLAFMLHPGELGTPPPPSSARGRRLAATVIDGRERLAIVEVDGRIETWTQGRPVPLDGDMVDVTVEPGQVTLRDGQVLKLTPRPPDRP